MNCQRAAGSIVILVFVFCTHCFCQTAGALPVASVNDSAKPQQSPTVVSQQYDTLAGSLPDTVIAQSIPYLVMGDIEVPLGKTVVIQAGTIFLFKNLTGLHVQGTLLAQGTKEHPVIFTSENDRSVNPATALYPNPYDWNGIYIHTDATGSILTYCKIMYSVYGIESETKFIRLDPVAFRQNGKSNFVLDGKDQRATDAPFVYVLSAADAKAAGVSVNVLADPHAAKRSILRYTGFAVTLAAGVAAVYEGLQWKKNNDNLKAISTDDPNVLRYHTEAEWFSLQSKRNKSVLYTGISAAVAVIGAAGFVWSFTF